MSKQKRAREASSETGRRIGVWLGARDLLGLEASWTAIADRLSEYSLFDVLNTVGRVNAALHNSSSLDGVLQLRLADGLLGQPMGAEVRRQVLRKLEREAAREMSAGNYVMFGQKPLATLLQVAVHACRVTDKRADRLSNIGVALLMTNDLLATEPASPQGADPNTPQGRQTWLYFLSHAAAEHGAEASVHLVARAADLYLSTPGHLRNHPDFVDLPSLFSEASGLSIDAYVLVLLAFLGSLYGINESNVHERDAVINVRQFESEHLQFTEADTNKFFALVGVPVEEFVEKMIRAYPRETLQPLYLLPLEESPIVRFGDKGVCHSVHLLEDRLTSGLYHLLLNARPESAFRAKFQRFLGSVFADYVDRSFERISGRFPKGVKRRAGKIYSINSYFRETDLQQRINDEPGKTSSLCDGLFIFNDMLVLIESKARLFPLAARSEGDGEKFIERLREIVVGGARQLDATINHIIERRLTEFPVEPRALRRVLPIIVSLQDITLNPMLRDWINTEVHKEGYFSGRRLDRARVAPLQLFVPGDLEMLELLVELSGKPLNALLAQFLNDDYANGYSFSSWAALRYRSIFQSKRRLTYHGERYHTLTQGATDFYLASRKSGTPEPDTADEGETRI
jgi:hypothetical protein